MAKNDGTLKPPIVTFETDRVLLHHVLLPIEFQQSFMG
jgi:hypothetical protein